MNARRRKRKQSGAYSQSASGELLRAAAHGALLTSGFVLAAGSPFFLSKLLHASSKSDERDEEKRRKQRFYRALHRLENRGFLSVVQETNGVRLRLTKEGEKTYRGIAIRSIFLGAPKNLWDKKWRLIFFDIPDEHKNIRHSLRQMLRNAGCCPLQKSVFVTPIPCHREINDIASFFQLSDRILYCETSSLGNAEAFVRKFFGMSAKR